MEKFPEHEPSVEGSSDEKAFQAYVEDLDLSPEDFNKKILDVGSGSSQFAKWAKDHQVSSEIYSIEPYQQPQEISKSLQGRAETMPFQDNAFDLVVSNASIPNVFLGEAPEVMKEKVRDSLVGFMRVVRPGGEIRLGRVLKGNVYESQQNISAAVEEVLEELRQAYGAEVEEIRYSAGDTYEYDAKQEPIRILARAYLIKIRKPN
ncbi:MAG TPA: methyltransferase domain-containing protein [Candidatus Paceibacterota bacterium]|nr:methyltransferase domain-containing protein [Candidatus Paceibacterota bacterium]